MNKTKRNKFLKELGEKANIEGFDSLKNTPSNNTINLTNDIIVSQINQNPDVDYEKLNFLGEGSFATVYRVQNKLTDSFRAMKIIRKSSSCSEKDDREILNEINILRTLDHPNILKIFEFYSSKESYSLVTELCSEGELFQEIIDKGPFNEDCSAYIMFQILSAINYCHNMKIIHRDLKPENILIADREKHNYLRVKICDFGTSKMFEKGAIQYRVVGSSYYIAPEVLKKKYDEKCDLWSCGVILYILLSGRPPFGGENDKQIMESVTSGKYDLHMAPFNKVSKSCIDLIKKLLELDPQKRISAQEALSHKWFKENKSKELFNKIKDQNILKRLIANLKLYKRDSIIQETALAYLVHNFPQLQDVINACKLFNQIDVNGDGKINEEELYLGLHSKVKSQSLKEDVEHIYRNLDMDNNGYIEYEEFVRAAVSKEQFMDDKILRYAFRYFDKDGSGKITFNEIENVFKEGVTDKTKVHESLSKIITEVDSNEDGVIDFKEFVYIMKKLLK